MLFLEFAKEKRFNLIYGPFISLNGINIKRITNYESNKPNYSVFMNLSLI